MLIITDPRMMERTHAMSIENCGITPQMVSMLIEMDDARLDAMLNMMREKAKTATGEALERGMGALRSIEIEKEFRAGLR